MGKEIEDFEVVKIKIKQNSKKVLHLKRLADIIKNPNFTEYVEKKQHKIVEMHDYLKDMKGKAFCEEFEANLPNKIKGLAVLQDKMLKVDEQLNQQTNPRPRKFTDVLNDQLTSNQKEGHNR